MFPRSRRSTDRMHPCGGCDVGSIPAGSNEQVSFVHTQRFFERNGQYYGDMRSTPRFSRGTSVIAALVLAAILGAVALGLHIAESNSANNAALTAQAAASQIPNERVTEDFEQMPPSSSQQTCMVGMDYDYTLPGTVTTTDMMQYTTTETVQAQQKQNTVCLSNASATAEIKQQY